ncbi:HupE/UreJ family protein [Hyphomonas sp.]|uniref:HupE/UreJ family protein n=1 Tax=Hyphomonas sp. TaxID=87 RepID=UPI0035287D44
MKLVRFLLLGWVASMIGWLPASAHDLRSGYLEVTQDGLTSYEVTWKPPTRAGSSLGVAPVFPADCLVSRLSAQMASSGEPIESWRVACSEVLDGRTLRFDGLQGAGSDVLVRYVRTSGHALSLRATSRIPHVSMPAYGGTGTVLTTYFQLGVEHILGGLDHLLFVLCLVFLIGDLRKLALTITAFTVAHSLTLAATVLGAVHMPVKPVEAVIALSIVFLASEVLAVRQDPDRLSEKAPWLIAFVFGLLHGFGFASALLDIGLPPEALPACLLAFNVGVEAGQLLFVAVVLTLLAVLKRVKLYQTVRPVAVYATGIVAMKWLIERML